MDSSRNTIFLVIFLLMSAQMLFSIVQVKHYQKSVKGLRGTGTLGIGQRRGGLFSGGKLLGEIIIVSYCAREDRVVCVRRLRGITVFAQFKDLDEYQGVTLEELRGAGIMQDAKDFKRLRKRHPYDPARLSKKKGALIQAVEAIELRLRREAEEEAACGAGCIPDMG